MTHGSELPVGPTEAVEDIVKIESDVSAVCSITTAANQGSGGVVMVAAWGKNLVCACGEDLTELHVQIREIALQLNHDDRQPAAPGRRSMPRVRSAGSKPGGQPLKYGAKDPLALLFFWLLRGMRYSISTSSGVNTSVIVLDTLWPSHRSAATETEQ